MISINKPKVLIMKTMVIALSGVSNSGKTSSIRLLRDNLFKHHNASETYHFEVENKEEDFITHLTIKNIKIAIISQGDYRPLIEKPLKRVYKQKHLSLIHI